MDKSSDRCSMSRRDLLKNFAYGTVIGTEALLIHRLATMDPPQPEISLGMPDCQPQPGKTALLVHYENWGEGSEKETFHNDNIQIMSFLLGSRGYELMNIPPLEATQDNVFGAIDRIAKRTEDGHRTVFYYAGHGKGSGICLEGRPAPLFPDELLEVLGKCRGKKAILLEACNSGSFTDYARDFLPTYERLNGNVIDDFVVLASCPPNSETTVLPEYLRRRKLGPVTFEFSQGRKLGPVTHTLHKLLSSYSDVNLSTADISFADEHYGQYLDGINSSRSDPNSPPFSFEIQRYSDTDFFL